jgi:transposase
MDYYAGIDVSLEQSFFGQLSIRVTRIGLEAGPLSQWLPAGLSEAGLETVLLETRPCAERQR